MTPAVKAFVEVLIDRFEQRIAELEGQVQKLTPQNSSLPPSTQHPHAKPKRPQRDGDGISAAPPGLPVSRNHDLRRAADAQGESPQG